MRFDPTQVPTFPVEIDQSHPLAQGLRGFWLPGLPPPRDLTGRYPSQGLMTIAGVTYYPQIGGTAIGPAYYSPSDNSPCAWVVNNGPILGGLPSFSILAICQTTVNSNSVGLDMYSERALSGNDLIQFTLSYNYNVGVSYGAGIAYRDDSGNLTYVSSNNAINDGKLHYIGATISVDDSSSSVTWQIYVDGLLDGSGSTTGTTSFTNSGILSSISGDTQATTAAGYNAAFEGYIPAVGVYAGILPPETFAQWKTEPFSMLKPIIRKKYYFPQTTSIININSYGEIFGESGQSLSGFMFGNSVGENSSYPITNLLGELALTSVGGQFAQEVSDGELISQIYIQQTEENYSKTSNSVNNTISSTDISVGSGSAVASPYVPVLLISSESQSVSQGSANPYVNSYVFAISETSGFSGQSIVLSASIEALGETTSDIAVQAYVESHVINIGSEEIAVSYGGFDNIKRYSNAEYLLLPFKNFNQISIG